MAPAANIHASAPFVEGAALISAGTLEAMRQEAMRTAAAVANAVGFTLTEMWLAKLDAAGQAAYENARYWVKRCYVENAAGTNTGDLTITAYSGADPRTLQVTATNLAELADDTHNLAAGTYVFVVGVRGQQSPGVKHYVFWSGGTGSCSGGFVKITSTGPLKGEWKAVDADAYDDNGGSDYSVTDEGTGVTAVDDVFPGFKWSDDTLHIASIYHRLKDV